MSLSKSDFNPGAAVLDALADAAERLVQRFTTQHIAMMLTGLAKLDHLPGSLLSMLSSWLGAFPDRITDFTPQVCYSPFQCRVESFRRIFLQGIPPSTTAVGWNRGHNTIDHVSSYEWRKFSHL